MDPWSWVQENDLQKPSSTTANHQPTKTSLDAHTAESSANPSPYIPSDQSEPAAKIPPQSVPVPLGHSSPESQIDTAPERPSGEAPDVTSSVGTSSGVDPSEPHGGLDSGVVVNVEGQEEDVERSAAASGTVSGSEAAPSDPEPDPAATPKARKRRKRSRQVSQRKINANRANAKKSTGPTTAPGKAWSSRNAIKHGILCNSLFVSVGPATEDRAEFLELADECFGHFMPQGFEERLYVETIIECVWRQKRALRYEAALIAHNSMHDPALREWSQSPKHQSEVARTRQELSRSLNLIPSRDLELMLRYEVQITRKLASAIGQLHHEQDVRKAEQTSNTATLHLPGGCEVDGESDPDNSMR
jgi:hypothetical protein